MLVDQDVSLKVLHRYLFDQSIDDYDTESKANNKPQSEYNTGSRENFAGE